MRDSVENWTQFQPLWWLRNPHAQTLWAALARRAPALAGVTEDVPLRDGECLRVVWGNRACSGPVAVLIHGMGGSARSRYMRGLASCLARIGFRCAMMQLRGVGLDGKRGKKFYHAIALDDLDDTLSHIQGVYRVAPALVVGFSLGGSILLNWLAMRGEGADVRAAVAVSPPFELAHCATRLESGFSRLYQWDLLRSVKRLVRDRLDWRNSPVPWSVVRCIKGLRCFDDVVTGPLHGFSGADDYYRRGSCRQRLHAIRTRTLIIHALDDPFIPRFAVPTRDEISATTELELCRHGGHVGFVAGNSAGLPAYWIERRIRAFIAENGIDVPRVTGADAFGNLPRRL